MIVTLRTQGLQTLAAGATVDLNAQAGNFQRNPSLISIYGMPPHTAKKSKITIRRAPRVYLDDSTHTFGTGLQTPSRSGVSLLEKRKKRS